jgi:hypothetical protein
MQFSSGEFLYRCSWASSLNNPQQENSGSVLKKIKQQCFSSIRMGGWSGCNKGKANWNGFVERFFL